MTQTAFDSLIAKWNDTRTPRTPGTTICDLLSTAAKTHANETALVDAASGQKSSYADYHQDVRRLAGFLSRQLGNTPQRVAYIGRRSMSAVVALSAIMTAGHAYVPIDPAWPRKRQLYVLNTLSVRGILHDDERLPLALSLARDSTHATTLVNAGKAKLVVPTRDAIVALWDGIAANDNLSIASGFNQRPEDFVPVAQIETYADHVFGIANQAGSAQNILEIGCGPGLILRRLIDAGHICTGIDPAPQALGKLRDWIEQNNHTATLITAFAEDVPDLALGSFDTILLSSCVQFFPDYAYLDRVLQGLSGLLKPTGRIVLADLVTPDLENRQDGHLCLTTDILAALLASQDSLTLAEVTNRDGRAFSPPLSHRWEATLRHQTAAPLRPASPITCNSPHLWRQTAPLSVPAARAESEAYVIFTSGTTGVPKGVSVSHDAVVNLIEWARESFRLPVPLDSLFTTSLGFDLSVFDMFGVLALGGCIHIAPDRQPFEPAELAQEMAAAPITLWDSAPAVLTSVLPFMKNASVAWRDRPFLVMLSGDWIPLNTLAELRAVFPNAHLLALGGATEATVWSNAFHVDAVDPSWPSIPYGTAMANARYYVLDDDRQPCPIGTEGDLFIAGACVANGYATDTDLTRQKFLPDPWWTGSDARMYATGDRAIWQPGGWIEFRGRMDDQVKISGYRIELGEVSAALSEIPGVRDVFVAALGEGETRHLAACLLCETVLEPDSIRADLRAQLPGHMIPARIEIMGRFPVGPTGKTDRAALRNVLSAPAKAAQPSQDFRTDPFARIWEEVLGRTLASADENFFAVGGHSLLAAQIPLRVRADLGVALELREVFLHPVFSELSALIASRRQDEVGA